MKRIQALPLKFDLVPNVDICTRYEGNILIYKQGLTRTYIVIFVVAACGGSFVLGGDSN